MYSLSSQIRYFLVFRNVAPYLLLLFILSCVASTVAALFEPFSRNSRIWMIVFPTLFSLLPTFLLITMWRKWINHLYRVASEFESPQAISSQISLLKCHENIGVSASLHQALLRRLTLSLKNSDVAIIDARVLDDLAEEAIFICKFRQGDDEEALEFCKVVFALLTDELVSKHIQTIVKIASRNTTDRFQNKVAQLLENVLMNWRNRIV